jgi:hypothetical protein
MIIIIHCSTNSLSARRGKNLVHSSSPNFTLPLLKLLLFHLLPVLLAGMAGRIGQKYFRAYFRERDFKTWWLDIRILQGKLAGFDNK